MNRRLTVLLAAALVGCGPAPATETQGPDAPTTKMEQLKIVNISQSDLGVCFPKPPATAETITTEALTGLLVAARPQVLECLVDPTRRGAERETRITVKSTLGASGVEHAVAGQNLTPEGEKCVREALGRYFAAVPAIASRPAASASAAPVTAEAAFSHVAGVLPTVKLGQNEGSDVAGTIRLQQSTWCDCYADWKDAAPRTLKAKIKLKKGAGPVAPAEVTIDPVNEPTADKVAACLKDKVKALKFNVTSDEVTIPYTFLFLHSSHDGPIADAPPEIRFAQLEALRGQRAAAAVVAVGARTVAAVTYDALVKKYKAKPENSLVEELKTKCAALLKTDDGWVASIERQLEMDQQTLALIVELKANDPQWAKAEAAIQSNVDATKKDLEAAKKTRTDDAGICPKERF
jgi:hypothetical protein